MYRIVLSLITIFSVCFSALAVASSENVELQGYGAFSNLNKDWMLMALYVNKAEETAESATPQRLEIKIAPQRFSQRRFRSLWLNALAIEHGADKMAAMQAELTQFFDIIQEPLEAGDTLIIERTEIGSEVRTEVKINYHTLADLSADFLPLIVQSLVGKHPPTQALKTGLTGEASLREQTNLAIRFDRLEPTLPRIAEISRWGKRILASHL
ncbi:MAG: chalcone isomerase family protein [Oleispira antarctica]|uniref:TonB-like protein n=1 Tax=Oleispira antarctica RB-8 TaxID=698738 RepID=R4YTL3_OLEAN|nr:chalcone isomerase family protein [Oleispira antarctica]MBQ0794273.1 chalcone isomerase family protein [Oleispira antarctica]CCK77103.1 TonB-like protein [Oleispira antarctica RB-8]|tara:strand:+ start:941 stop:1576 length:636 start_codon:yes stop_codon:yes gene_type:complete